MQISQTNTSKMAYQDKITNNYATQAKILFLQQQLSFLLKFKQDFHHFQSLSKPSSSPQLQQIQSLYKKLASKSKYLNQDVVFIRRDISMIQVNNQNIFQNEVANNYVIKSQETNLRLQKVQVNVQIAQQKSKIESYQQLPKLINIRPQKQDRINQYIQNQKRVKQALRKRLILVSKINQIKNRKKHILQKQKLINNNPISIYNYQRKHKQHYHNKSSDMLKYKQYIPKNLSFKKPQKKPKLFIDPITKLQTFKLNLYQKQILQSQLKNLHLNNQKIQMINEQLKKSIQIQQDNKLLSILTHKKYLDYQKSIVRQVLAYRTMESRFNQKLAICSYKWSYQYGVEKKHQGSKEWIEQPQAKIYKQVKWERQRKTTSLQKIQDYNVTFLKNQQNTTSSAAITNK